MHNNYDCIILTESIFHVLQSDVASSWQYGDICSETKKYPSCYTPLTQPFPPPLSHPHRVHGAYLNKVVVLINQPLANVSEMYPTSSVWTVFWLFGQRFRTSVMLYTMEDCPKNLLFGCFCELQPGFYSWVLQWITSSHSHEVIRLFCIF